MRGAADSGQPLRLSWRKAGTNGYVVIGGDRLGGRILELWYVELYMRPGSQSSYPGGVIRHRTELVSADPNGRWLKLRCELEDGVVVEHEIAAGVDVVDFHLLATGPADRSSDIAWGAPCIAVDRFTGCGKFSYLPKSFIFLDGELTRLPVDPWALEAIETPGQVWCPRHVDRADVEPHPLSELVPGNGLIGCFSSDESMIMATAWQPYQDLFQGIITCLHCDFRINGLRLGQTKRIRGKIYITSADVPALLARYEQDFPEHLPPQG